MTDAAKDFRYTIGDKTVEAYQLTDSSRFQQALWPDWLDSRWFITIDGAPWFELNGQEVPIPDLAWVARDSAGNMSFIDALEFENYVKVVPHVAEVFEPTVEPGAAVAAPPAVDDTLLAEVKLAFGALQHGDSELALGILKSALTTRAVWCTCAPGQCEELDPWICREKSPLVKKPRKPRKKK